MLEHILVPINRAGWPFIGLFLVASLLLAFVWQPLFWLGLIASAWCTFFFRDPPRVVPQRSGLVVAPADGRVTMVTEAVPPPELSWIVVPVAHAPAGPSSKW